jgi:hypothetical protein
MYSFIGKKILIKDKNYDESLAAYQEDEYDLIFDNENYKFHTGHEANIKNVQLSFETFGTIDATEMVYKSLSAIQDILSVILKAIKDEDKLKVNISRGKEFSITVKDDHAVTANMIQQYISEMAPDVTCKINSPIHSDREFTFSVIHDQGEEILSRAINDLITVFENLKKGFA